jgi:hypothetical protein
VESLLPFIVVAVVLVVAAVLFSRRQRDSAELGSPVRLGPSWSPPEDELADDPSALALRERDLTVAKGAVDLDERAVTTTLEAWWEYLSVLRVRPLPRGHRYRFYDPYDPPATELGPNGPVPDPVRVARDVAQRTSVAEIDAVAVLQTVVEAPALEQPDAVVEEPTSGPEATDRPRPSSGEERRGSVHVMGSAGADADEPTGPFDEDDEDDEDDGPLLEEGDLDR